MRKKKNIRGITPTIGTSTIAKAFMSAVQLCDRVQLVAVYSRKFETGLEFGKLFGCENVYTDLYEMAKSGIAFKAFLTLQKFLVKNFLFSFLFYPCCTL